MQRIQKTSSLYINQFSSSLQSLEITKVCVSLLLRKHFLQPFLFSPSQKPVGVHWDLLTYLITTGRLLRREPAPESRYQKVAGINDVTLCATGYKIGDVRAITHPAELWERAVTLTFSRK